MKPSDASTPGVTAPGDPGAGVIYRGRLRFDARGQLRDAQPPLTDGALGSHAGRLNHTARYAHELRELVHITLYCWFEGQLWTQQAYFVPRRGGVEAVLAPPLAPLGVPNDQPLLEMAMAHSNDVILVTEAQPVEAPGPRVVYANSAFTRMTGYAVDEIIGQTPRILQGPGSERDAIERMGRALRAWEPIRVEITNYKKDGTPFVVELDIRPVADATGWYTHWVSVQRDVTPQRLAEARDLRLARLEAIATLAGGVAHDFNNLLVGMLGNLELARELAMPGTELAALIADAEEAAEQSKHLTRQLMTFSKDAAPFGTRRTRFDLRTLAREAAQAAARGGLAEIVEPDDSSDQGSVLVEADRSQIGQVITNVVRSALEAMRNRGRVTVFTRPADPEEVPSDLDPRRGYAVTEIADQGPGLSEEDLRRVFEPYFATKDRGGGIGLAVSWTIMSWHEGGITATCDDGAGLTVRLYLPRVADEVSEGA